jgi:hypothetical protein
MQDTSEAQVAGSPALCPNPTFPEHKPWSCPHCLARLNANFDQTLRQVMIEHQGWTPRLINQFVSNAASPGLRIFDQTPWEELTPVAGTELERDRDGIHQGRGIWNMSCVRELQGRMDRARRRYERMSAGWHEDNASGTGEVGEVGGGMNQGMAIEMEAGETRAIDGAAEMEEGGAQIGLGEAAGDAVTMGVGMQCRDDEDRELHPQWTCQRCLSRLNESFDHRVLENMRDMGWTESQIIDFGSLRQFDSKLWSEMIPTMENEGKTQVERVREWWEIRLEELEVRQRTALEYYRANFGEPSWPGVISSGT